MGRSRRCHRGVALVCVIAAGPPALAETPAPTPTPDAAAAPDDWVERLARELAGLRRDLEEERKARRTAGALTAALSGFVQADAVAYREDSEHQLDSSTGKPLNQTRFLIRRAHLRADAEWRFLSGALEVEASTVNDPGVRLFDAEVSARWAQPTPTLPPYLALSVGLLRIPFGFENQERDTVRLFLERSAVVRALFPGENDLGLRLHGGWRFLRYQLAVTNGHPLGETDFPSLDPTAQKDVLGRVGVDTAFGQAVTLQAGLSGLHGTGLHAGTAATKDTLVWRDANGDGIVQPSEVQAIQGTAATPSQEFERYAVGADLRVTASLPLLGTLCVYGELLWASNLDRAALVADPVAVGRALREMGGYVGVTQEVTRHAVIGVRYDRYNPDADAADQQGAARVPSDVSYSTLAVAVAGQLPPWGRLTVEYDHNTNALGRTAGGLPTTLGSDALTFRAQMVF